MPRTLTITWAVCAFAALLLATGCDDASPGSAGGRTDGAATTDGGSLEDARVRPDADLSCEGTADCAGGRVCVEGTCTDCLGNGECGHLPGGVCLDGGCCAPGSEGCTCGAGCGADLACADDRCVPCPAGSEGCACDDGACGEDLRCSRGSCAACPWGTDGCPCDGADCGAGLACRDGLCRPDRPLTCADLDCAADGRTCEEAPEARCGGCDTVGGFVDDGNGSCVRAAACARDADCPDGLTCLEAGGRSTCMPPPACVVTRPAAGAEGAVWSPAEGRCVACPSCAGVPGSTGALWPTTSRAGDCLCETEAGWYYDVAFAIDRPRPCDADGDGWVQRAAQQYVESADPALASNARCAVTTIERVVLRNERGETLALSVADDLGVAGGLPRYEPVGLDDDALVADDRFIPPWGAAKPPAAQLNPLHKLCVSADADYNGNAVPDVDEHPEAETEHGWMRPFMRLAHFAELHRTTFEGGTLTIAEIPRCDDAFPLAYDGDAEHWRECHRRRPSDYAPGLPGFDFAAWSCAAERGACPGPDAEALAEVVDGAPRMRACSAGALERFAGMNHHSQFQCVRFVQGFAAAVNERSVAEQGIAYDVNLCAAGEGGAAACAAAPAENGQAGWALARALARGGDQYTRGCQLECPTLLPLCPGYAADESNTAGCGSDREDFGAMACNGCPGSGGPCDTGLRGICGTGTAICEERDGQPPALACMVEVMPDPARSDAFGDGVDQNCDGFDGQLEGSIFVSADAGGGPRGTADRPYRTLAQAFEHARGREESFVIYVAGATAAVPAGEPLVIPANVAEIHGAMAAGGGPSCGGEAINWCESQVADRTRIDIDNPLGIVIGERSRDLRLRRFDVRVTPDEGRHRGGARDGYSIVGLRVESPDRTVVLEDFELTTADAPDGLDGAAHGAAATAGPDGALGSAGCQEAAGFCGHECPDGYWRSGRGAACACGGGAACSGGDGGIGGEVISGCAPGAEDVAPTAGQRGGGDRGGAAGAAGATICGGDDNPEGSIGGDGLPGDPGEAGGAGSGFFSPVTGWLGRAGLDGTAGANGGGGGGGGGDRKSVV